MKYVLLLMGQTDDAGCGDPGGADPAEYMAFDERIQAAGVVVGGYSLHGPENGVRVVAPAEGETVVTAGPFAESREFVGGCYVIDVPGIDEAIAWAKQSPGAKNGWIEVRPLAEY